MTLFLRCPLAMMLVLAGSSPVSASNVVRPKALGGVEVRSDEILVKFKTLAAAPAVSGALAGASGSVKGKLRSGWSVVTVPDGMSVEAALAYYKGLGIVEGVSPNHVFRPLVAVPNDPLYDRQEALENINAAAAWEFENGKTRKVLMAIIDTGVQGTHPDLSDRMNISSSAVVNGANDVTSGVATDPCGHGTQVAGLAGATGDNAKGIVGVNWSSEIISINVFPSCGTAANDVIAEAIDHAVSVAGSDRMVINLSLGSVQNEATTSGCATVIETSVQAAVAAGHIVVAAAGNQGSANANKVVECPAKMDEVIAVGATTLSGSIASFSAQGAQLELTAPGQNLRSTSNNSDFTSAATGTSFAAPLVAGVASLMIAAKPTIDLGTLRSNLRASATDLGAKGFDTVFGYGQLDAFRALRLTVRGTLANFEGQEKVTAFPLPFQRGTHNRITFAIPPDLQGSGVTITIYGQSGELIRTLEGKTSWDAKNEQGTLVAAGLYLFRVKTSAGDSQGRLVVR